MRIPDSSRSSIPAQQRALLSSLWIFVLLNALIRDVHQVLGHTLLDQTMSGQSKTMPLNDPFLVASVLLQIPLLMVVLPRLLPDRALRIVNSSAALFYLLMTTVHTVFGQPDSDDLFFAAVKGVALGAILKATRPRLLTSSKPTAGTGSVVALFLVIAAWSLALPQPGVAQQKGDLELGLGVAAVELDVKLGGDTGSGLDGRVGYMVTDQFQLEVQHASSSAVLDGSFRATTLNGLYYFRKAGKIQHLFGPYALLGAGQAEVRLDDVLNREDALELTDDALAFRAALGARIVLGSERTLLRVEVHALFEGTLGQSATHVGLSSVFILRFGQE